MRSRVNMKWLKHLSSQVEKEQFTKTVLASLPALNRLRDILEEELRVLSTQEESLQDYSDAAWSHKQAHRNGERAFAKKVLELLCFQK
jgi:hypothetical protein